VPMPSRRRSAWQAAFFHALLSISTGVGCRGEPQATPEGNDAPLLLLAQVKSGLVDRDRRLFAFHLEGRVLEAGSEARFSFDYRAPQRMLGVLHSDGERRLAFDGEWLYRLEPPLKRLTRTRLGPALSPAQRAGTLAQIFSPFVPEGFRAPLLPREREKVEARQVSHPRAAHAVELRVQADDPQTGPVEVRYLLRWPALDFLEKRIDGPGSIQGLVRVTAEHCEPSLKLCVPKALRQSLGDQEGARTDLQTVSLNQPSPADSFTIAPPAGFTVLDGARAVSRIENRP